jgi:hypothetical protein
MLRGILPIFNVGGLYFFLLHLSRLLPSQDPLVRRPLCVSLAGHHRHLKCGCLALPYCINLYIPLCLFPSRIAQPAKKVVGDVSSLGFSFPKWQLAVLPSNGLSWINPPWNKLIFPSCDEPESLV